MSVIDFAWALELRKDFPGLFCFTTYLAGATDHLAAVRTGDFWYALPEGGFVMLESADRSRCCPGYIEHGEWKPLPDRPPGPLANKIRLIEPAGPYTSIDPFHQRPGLVIADPIVRHERSASLRDYGRAIWVPGQSLDHRGYGRLALEFPDGNIGYYPFWSVWTVSIEPGVDLLKPTGLSLLACAPQFRGEGGDLEARSGKYLADWLGLGTFDSLDETSRRRRPRRWEVVMLRELPSERRIPCIVISPTNFNESQNDLVVLRCIRYCPGDESRTTLVPLAPNLIINGSRWSVDLLRVRGLTLAHRHYTFCAPRLFYDRVDWATCTRLHEDLESLYG